MPSDIDFRERVIERLGAVEGQLSALALQLEASDNSLRQLLRFDKERFGRIEAALQAFENVVSRTASKDDLEGLSARLGMVERRVETLEVQSHMGKGQREFLLRVWAWVGPMLGAIITAWAVRGLF